MNLKRLIVASGAVLSMCAVHAETYTWTGGTGDWETPANWTAGGVQAESAPGVNDDVVLPAPTDPANNYTVTANAAISVKSLTVGSSGAGADCLATFESNTLDEHSVSGNCFVYAGGSMTHRGGSTDKEVAKLDLSVGGDMTVGAGGVVDVIGKGYLKKKGLGGGTSSAHGGEGAGLSPMGPCYGSIRYPHEWGSGGDKYSGSGAIYLRVVGRLTVDGTITAATIDDTHVGSAGSVWLDVGELRGGGTIAAHGQPGTNLVAGGGRIAIYLRNINAQSSDFGGFVIAYGGVKGNFKAAAGTIYWQTASQEDGDGSLIIDNNGVAAGWDSRLNCTCIGPLVTDAEVGELILRGKAQVRIEEGCELKIRRNLICEDGKFACDATDKGKVIFVGEADSHISGKLQLVSVECAVPGKKFYFDTTPGNDFSIVANGAFNFVGEEGEPMQMLPEGGSGTWSLSCGAGADFKLYYAALSNCVPAAASIDVVVYGGTDLGGNGAKVKFFDIIKPGARIVWTGEQNSAWDNAGNWDPHRNVLDSDVIVISGTAACSPVLEGFTQLSFNSIEIEEGGSLTVNGVDLTITNNLAVAGTLTLNGGPLTVRNYLKVASSGALVCSGLETISCGGDVTIAAASGLVPGRSLFVLNGAGSHFADFGGAVFNRLSIAPLAGDYAFESGFSAAVLSIPSPASARTLTFAKGSTTTVANLFVDGRVAGAAALTMKSSESGAKWNLVNTRCAFVMGVVVSDSNAAGGLPISAYAPSSEDRAGSTIGWTFGLPFSEWVGPNGGAFETPGNWSPNGMPGPNDTVFISADEAKTLTASSEISVSNVFVGGGAARITLNANNSVFIAGDACLLDQGTLSLTKPMVVSGGMAISAGGVLTHDGGVAVDNGNSVDLTAESLWIAAGGKIDVVEKGYLAKKGPGFAFGGAGSYGGKGAEYQGGSGDCYGSICCPTNWGSGSSQNGNGAGRVRLRISGTVTLDGDIEAGNEGLYARNSLGSGGSVWITCGKLLGAGDIDADSICGNLLGGGGRIAVYLVDSNAHFADCSVTMHANSARTSWFAGACGTIYLKEAGWKVGQVLVGGSGNSGTGLTQIGIPRDLGGDRFRDTRKFGVIVRESGHLSLVGDMTVDDIDLAVAGASLDLNQFTLTVRSMKHKDGRDWATGVTVTSNEVDGVWGKIVWKNPPGCLISIR